MKEEVHQCVLYCNVEAMCSLISGFQHQGQGLRQHQAVPYPDLLNLKIIWQ